MPTATLTREPRVTVADPWRAHNMSSHIPNAEAAHSIRDGHAGRDIFGAFATGEEAVRAMLES